MEDIFLYDRMKRMRMLAHAWAQKYNPHHNHLGQFSTAGEAHISVARDGTRTLGPKHPDNQLDPVLKNVHPSAAWTKNFEATYNQRLKNFADSWTDLGKPITADALKAREDAHIVALVTPGELWTRTSSKGLQGILTDGRFKSAFETNKTGAAIGANKIKLTNYLESRAEQEEQMFGYDQKTKSEDRPIYGYLSDGANGEQNFASAYGDVAIRFKPEVRAKSTFTLGDSLDEGGSEDAPRMLPNPVLKPTGTAASNYNSPEGNTSLIKDVYTETQMHGGVSKSHIAHVVFHSKAPSAALTKLLQRENIPYSVAGAS